MEETINLPNGEQITIGGETHTAETSAGVKITIKGGDESDLRRVMERMESGCLTSPDGASLLHMAAASMTANHCGFFMESLKCDINGTDDQENGADVTWSATDGETPLHFAANRGSKEIAELLISKGADLNANSSRGTPLHYAAASGNHEVLEYFLELKADPNTTNSSVELSPLFQALRGGYVSIECLKLLVKMGLKPIEKAALENRREVVELLFPLTSRIEGYPDWSVSGLMQYAESREDDVMSKSKLKEISLLAKAKGGEAFKRGHYFDAATWYKKALEFDPIDAKVLSNRSLCFTLLNNGKKALKCAKECIVLKPKWATAHYREGSAWKVLKDFEKAAIAFSKALALEPHNELIHEELRAMRAEAARLEKGSL